MSAGEGARRPLKRSPNYPSIDLGKAIDRVRQLYNSERQHAMPAVQAVRHWGYSSLNSPGGGQLAALARFGLLDDEGTKDDRKVRVTDLAVQILAHPDQGERESAIRKAALLPSVHQDMWANYGMEMPSEDNLKWFLTRDRGFSENGALDFIKEYRATVNFAKLDTGSDGAGETTLPTIDAVSTPPSPEPAVQARLLGATSTAPPSVRFAPVQLPTISFPLASGNMVSVAGLSDLTEGDWAQFMAVLTALKPSLVKPHAAPLEEGDGE